MTQLIYLIAQGILVGPLSKKFGEEKVIRGAIIGNALGFVLMLLAYNFLTMIISISLFMLLNALLKPSALAFISKNSQMNGGMAMGLAESYMSLGRIIGPLWAGALFDINIYYPYLSGTVFFVLMFIVSLSKRFNIKNIIVNN